MKTKILCQDIAEMKRFTPLYLSTYMKKKPMQITIEDIKI